MVNYNLNKNIQRTYRVLIAVYKADIEKYELIINDNLKQIKNRQGLISELEEKIEKYLKNER